MPRSISRSPNLTPSPIAAGAQAVIAAATAWHRAEQPHGPSPPARTHRCVGAEAAVVLPIGIRALRDDFSSMSQKLVATRLHTGSTAIALGQKPAMIERPR